ncbi:hypothetical protein [Actinophytocola sp.]|uniref:hypothetical protein n=1 Tax=Actinophytocola sp. TaxID=1872138 RepID=UPI002ED51F33
MSWPETVAERRMLLFAVLMGLVIAGWMFYFMRNAWLKTWEERERRRPKPDNPVYAGAAPPTGPYVAALGVGAIRAAEYEEPVDKLDYTRSKKRAQALLVEELGESARDNVPRALRALLGGEAEDPASGIALVEEALRQRTKSGPELWTFALEQFATARGLPYAERQSMLAIAVDIGRAEDRLRLDGLLGPGEYIPSLLANHWADGVHVVRCAMRAGWLPTPQGLEYLERAGGLTAKWYPTWSTVISAQLLPALLSDDAAELVWRVPVARRLMSDGPSPFRVPLRGGFGLAGTR